MDQRLCVVIGTLDLGGTERHLARILPKLHGLGWDITVLVMKQGNALTAHLRNNGVDVVEFPVRMSISRRNMYIRRPVRCLLVFHWLLWQIWKMRNALLHFYLPETYILGGLGAVLTCRRKPMLMSRRSLNHYQNNRPWLRPLEYWLHRRMHKILGNSRAVIDQLHHQEGVPPGKLVLIYNGIDTAPFKAQPPRHILRKELGMPLDALVLVIAANLIPYKGHADLLRALSTIRNDLPANWHLQCAGYDAGILDELKAQARASAIEGRVHWLGEMQDIRALLKAADIGVLCSHEEGFSNALLEYMAAGLPVVVTDVGGNAEAVVDGETGWIVPAGDPSALAAKILDLALNEKRRRVFGSAGRRRVEQCFSLETCVASYDSLYKN